MKWKIEIEIEGQQPPAHLIQKAKTEAENVVLELVSDYTRFCNATVRKESKK